MAELKTQVNDASVTDFLDSVVDEQKRQDSYTILEMMTKLTKEEPKMWGSSIVGFGAYRYKYASGREGEWPRIGFSPRRQSLTLYIMTGASREPGLLEKLGKHSTGKSCLYIKKLADVDMKVLKKLVQTALAEMKKRYP